MPGTFTYTFNTPVYKGTSTINTEQVLQQLQSRAIDVELSLGKPWNKAKVMSVGFSVSLLGYYADKFHGQTVEVCMHLILIRFVLLTYYFIRRLPKPNLPTRDMSHMA
jgi:hypothetical protein